MYNKPQGAIITNYYAILLLNENFFGKNTTYSFKNVYEIDARIIIIFKSFTLHVKNEQ